MSPDSRVYREGTVSVIVEDLPNGEALLTVKEGAVSMRVRLSLAAIDALFKSGTAP